MKHLFVPAVLGTLLLTWPLVSADAQMGFSPAAPPVTSSGINRSSNVAPVMTTRPVQAAAPGMMQSGYPMAQQTLSTEPIDPDHKLNRGDQLFRVQEDRDDKIWPLTVTDSGEVLLPLPGCRVKAVGKSTNQLTADIKSLLEREYYYHATVDLGLVAVAARASRGRVYVTGAVKQTGSVELPLDAPMTASQAIDQMGGLVDFSNPKRTVVLRKGGPPKGIPVDVRAVQNGELDKDVVLQPGDTVKVPEARIGIRF